MKITIESTTKIVDLVVKGVVVPARIWEGVTENGVRCHLYVTRIAADDSQDLGEFSRELHEHKPPTPEILVLPLRLVL